MESALPPQASIGLRTVKSLLKESFLVPQYQRGYRWSSRQVLELLNDLQAFQRLGAGVPDSFYCLQPVIVKRNGAQCEVVDGQQRLTTIAILLQYIRAKVLISAAPPFPLAFATRKGSAEFLQDIKPERKKENADFHYMVQAWETIEKWFANQDDLGTAAMLLYPILLDRTQVIWYELGPNDTAQAVFGRINSGKIPLTDAELVRALFLQQRAELREPERKLLESRQQEIAREWDVMEARLQQDEFWYFLTSGKQEPATRLDLLLELGAGTHGTDTAYATFDHYQKELKATVTESVQVRLLQQWQQLQALFAQLESWYQDRELYHRVGYLVAVGTKLGELVKQAEGCSKSAFKAYLDSETRKQVRGDWDSWSYKPNRKELVKVLLLFNIETLQQNDTTSYRFPFHAYKGTDGTATVWSLEHIHPQHAQGLNGSQAYRAWLKDMQQFLNDREAAEVTDSEEERGPKAQPEDLVAETNRLLAQPEIGKVEFDSLEEKIMARFGEPGLDTLDNLALLTRDDNSVLNNGSFPQKRASIIELEKEGAFIPIATRNVFLKYYTPGNPHLNYWTRDDRKKYREAISSTLKNYLATPATSISAS